MYDFGDKSKHVCYGDNDCDLICLENDDGSLTALTNAEYEWRVSYCPFCGKASL